ncbi:MAG: IS1634 family transposase [bacterium]
MSTTYTADRLDDIPFLVEVLRQLKLDEILEEHVGTHGNTRLLMDAANGLALLIWMVYLLSEGEHRKVVVTEWVEEHASVLSAALGTTITAADFSDDRLSTLLCRLQRTSCWEGIETAFFFRMLMVYDPGIERIHLDATTGYGFHTHNEEGLMRFGFAKSGTPSGRTQVKLMAATSSRGQLLACTISPGNTSDSPLYQPLIERVRRQVGAGRLYVGDSKMSPLAIRTDIVTHGDSYLVPLPRTETGGNPEAWLQQHEEEGATTTLLWREAEKECPTTLLGGVWETTRTVGPVQQRWEERVLVVYSTAMAKKQRETLARHIMQATDAIQRLTPPPKRGHKQYRNEATLQAAIDAILQKEGVKDLLKISWREEMGVKKAANRLVITGVTRNHEAIAAREEALGWRVMVTNAAVETLSATAALLAYREEYVVEHCFHMLKDKPVGLRPLWVRTDAQIRGLACLLTLAVRILTYIEHRLHDALVADGETLSGLHPGQPHIKTNHPTAKRILQAICRQQPTRIGVNSNNARSHHVINFTPLLKRILTLLEIPAGSYTSLTNTS